jgi:hypothetical protein
MDTTPDFNGQAARDCPGDISDDLRRRTTLLYSIINWAVRHLCNQIKESAIKLGHHGI